MPDNHGYDEAEGAIYGDGIIAHIGACHAALIERIRVSIEQIYAHALTIHNGALRMVTHDQTEAITLADRVVMNDRVIQQIGTPMENYHRPANRFVARFVGSPAMTMLPVTLETGDGGCTNVCLNEGAVLATRVPMSKLNPQGSYEIGLRPENVTITRADVGVLAGSALIVERLGDRTLVRSQLANGSEIIGVDRGALWALHRHWYFNEQLTVR